ncbi:helix-turn-helix domain-containing protein [Lachnoclostridium sp. An181]|uniref:helix-turn-helix domain-containing protein n=1 Tax=Lachnoclostridium sp. An181 TaxID=1965575 RepID=UPI000B3A3F6C|nr:helix-turn-helix transcriptional regulator [Lachnoclostridium sp. An181]OUP50124.1 hypothetical protein B5F18_04800 [Lachnoclostridium sp. An181]
MPEIGRRIKLKREELGITQEELAGRLGYKSKTTIAKIENGTNDIVQSKVAEFAKALHTTPAYLMGWADVVSLPKQQTDHQHSRTEDLIIKEMKKLTKKGQKKLLDTAREMACNPLYNPNYEIEVNAAHARTDIEIPAGIDTSEEDIMNEENF